MYTVALAHVCREIPMERPMTGMTCTRCRTEDPSRSSSASPLGLPPGPSVFLFHRRSARRSSSPSASRSGYLLRGRCGLNLINSMRHLDKCAPRTRIQRIIFILIHRSSPLLSPACFPFLLLTDPSPRSPASLCPPTSPYGPSLRTLEPFLRLSDPRFILVKREHAARG